MRRFQDRLVVGALAGALLIAVASNAGAFDGDRKGFVLGGGIGGGTASIQQEMSGFFSGKSDRETNGTFVTDFRIGGAFNENWMLYYDNQVWWGSAEFTSGSKTFALGIGLVGLSYYFTADTPSWYLVGSIGVSTFGPADDYGAQSGFGISGGVGYEFARHWSAEAVVGWGSPEEESGGTTLTTDAFVFAVRIHGLAY
jgi:hypothetical protein